MLTLEEEEEMKEKKKKRRKRRSYRQEIRQRKILNQDEQENRN